MPKPRSSVLAALLLVVIAVSGTGAATTPLLVHRGGVVLASPQVSAIYVGDYWRTPAGAADALANDAFLQAWVAGPGASRTLAQYGVGAGSFASSEVLGGTPPSPFTDAEAQAIVQQELAAGRVVNGLQTVHVIYLPPGIVLTKGGDSSQAGLGGYHASYLDPGSGRRVYYAVIAYGDSANGVDVTSDGRGNLSVMSSRVLAGAFTNPDVGGVAGWIDDVNGEVGDIAFALSSDALHQDVWTFENSFAVVRLWSNREGDLVGGSNGGRGTGAAATSTGLGTLSVTPATQQAVPGSTVTYTIQNAVTSRDTLTLSLDDPPAGVTAAFGSTVLAPGASTALTVTVASGVTAGTSVSLRISGISPAFAVETVTATLSVVATLTPATPGTTPPAAADFAISVTPATQDMVRGGDLAKFTITTTASGDERPKLKLKTSGLPRGLKAYFSRSQIVAGDTATVVVRAHRDTKLRTYAFAIKVASDRVDQFVPVTIVLK
jgi:hypothetical protein